MGKGRDAADVRGQSCRAMLGGGRLVELIADVLEML